MVCLRVGLFVFWLCCGFVGWFVVVCLLVCFFHKILTNQELAGLFLCFSKQSCI